VTVDDRSTKALDVSRDNHFGFLRRRAEFETRGPWARSDARVPVPVGAAADAVVATLGADAIKLQRGVLWSHRGTALGVAGIRIPLGITQTGEYRQGTGRTGERTYSCYRPAGAQPAKTWKEGGT